MKKFFFTHMMLIVNTVLVCFYLSMSVEFVIEGNPAAGGLSSGLAAIFLMQYIVDRLRLLRNTRDLDNQLRLLEIAYDFASSERTKAHAVNFKYLVIQKRVTEQEHEIRRLKRALKAQG